MAQIVVNYLNEVGLAAKGAARGNVPGTDQRHAMAYASTVDLDEAYRVGQMAALLAAGGESGYMSTILRKPGPIYSVRYDKVPLRKWPTASGRSRRTGSRQSGYDVTDEFVRYAQPLVGEDMVSLPMVDGRQRLDAFPADLRQPEAGQVRSAGGSGEGLSSRQQLTSSSKAGQSGLRVESSRRGWDVTF